MGRVIEIILNNNIFEAKHAAGGTEKFAFQGGRLFTAAYNFGNMEGALDFAFRNSRRSDKVSKFGIGGNGDLNLVWREVSEQERVFLGKLQIVNPGGIR